MAGLRSLYRNWRKNGNCHFGHPQVFYLSFVPDSWLPGYFLPDPCLLDECKKLHQKFQEKSIKVSVKKRTP